LVKDGQEGKPMTTSSANRTCEKITPQERFRRLAADWKEKSRHMSNTAQMAMLIPYQKIIGMGVAAIPLILEELRREPDQWFWALEAIADENPVTPEAAGRVRLMAQAWVEWGKQNGYVSNDPER
jgi:hypothetical protein